ncbi:apolipoprotein L2-like [Ambystoma mexicanum]|uniref:apolipoprotein L2-like n=1 Tax=Ambystoma mexicanum TaxID=8296 RepID=UPI0037E8660F
MEDKGGGQTRWYLQDTDDVEDEDGDHSLEMDIMEALQQTAVGMKKFQKLLEDRTPSFEATITTLRRIAKGLDHFHHSATIASITGGAVSAAGGITTVVGMILAPFTFGASLIVTGVGLGVAAAGGVTSASATISDTVNERLERAKVEDLIRKYQADMKVVELCLTSVHCQLERLSQHPDFSLISAHQFESMAFMAIPRAGRGIANVVEIVRLAQLGKAAGGLARGIRIAGVASGVLTGLFLIMDAIYIAKDAKELQDGTKTEAAEKIRQTANELEKGLQELRELGKTFERAQINRQRKGRSAGRSEAPPEVPVSSPRIRRHHRRLILRRQWHGLLSPRRQYRQNRRAPRHQHCLDGVPIPSSV